MVAQFLQNTSMTLFSLKDFGPEIESTQSTAFEHEARRLNSEKKEMAVRMMRSEAFQTGRMKLQDIADLTQLPMKLLRKVHRDVNRS